MGSRIGRILCPIIADTRLRKLWVIFVEKWESVEVYKSAQSVISLWQFSKKNVKE